MLSDLLSSRVERLYRSSASTENKIVVKSPALDHLPRLQHEVGAVNVCLGHRVVMEIDTKKNEGQKGDDMPIAEVSSEEYFIICEAIRALWASLSPPSKLGTSGKVTPMQFLRLMWQLDAVMQCRGERQENDSDKTNTVRLSWRTFISKISEMYGEDSPTSPISHQQFESFFWSFSDSIHPPSERASIFEQWAIAITTPKREEVSDIMSLMNCSEWRMNAKIQQILGVPVDAVKAQKATPRETSLMVIEHLLKRHSDAPWQWWHRVRPILLSLVPALRYELDENKQDLKALQALPAISRALTEISSSTLRVSEKHVSIQNSAPSLSRDTRAVLNLLGLKNEEQVDHSETFQKKTEKKNPCDDDSKGDSTTKVRCTPCPPKGTEKSRSAKRLHNYRHHRARSMQSCVQPLTRAQHTQSLIVSQSPLNSMRPSSASGNWNSPDNRVSKFIIEPTGLTKQKTKVKSKVPLRPNTAPDKRQTRRFRFRKLQQSRQRPQQFSNRPGSSNNRLLMTVKSTMPLRTAGGSFTPLQPGTMDLELTQPKVNCRKTPTLASSRYREGKTIGFSRMKLRHRRNSKPSTEKRTNQNGEEDPYTPLAFRRLRGRNESLPINSAPGQADFADVSSSEDQLQGNPVKNVEASHQNESVDTEIQEGISISNAQVLVKKSVSKMRFRKKRRPVGLGKLTQQNVPLYYSLNVINSGYLQSRPVLKVTQQKMVRRHLPSKSSGTENKSEDQKKAGSTELSVSGQVDVSSVKLRDSPKPQADQDLQKALTIKSVTVKSSNKMTGPQMIKEALYGIRLARRINDQIERCC